MDGTVLESPLHAASTGQSWFRSEHRATLGRAARIAALIFPPVWFAILLASVARTRPPVVFGDELGYYLPIMFGTATENYVRWTCALEYPSYLYFWIGSLLPQADLHFSIKALNAACVAAASLPAYVFARRYLPNSQAALFACFVILTPIASFARYVMPEPVYFFGFWCCLAIFAATIERSAFLSAAATGVAIGALSLIKPHAIAVELAMAAAFVLRDRPLRGVLAAATLVAAFLLCRAGLTTALLGHAVWSPLSGSYTGMVGGHIDWNAAVFNAVGHAIALVAAYGPLLGAVLIWLYRRPPDRAGELVVVTVCLIGAMVAMTVHFSQGVFQIGPDSEKITRLHGRYYIYGLPLLVLLGAAVRNLPEVPLIQKALLALAALAPLCTILVVAIYDEGGFVDNPGLFLWTKELWLRLAAVQVVILAYCYFAKTSRRILAAAIVFVAYTSVAATIEISIVPALREQMTRGIDAAFLMRHGEIAALVGRSDGVVMGSGTDLTRAMFYLRSISIGKTTPAGTITDATLPSAAWVLLLPGIDYRGTRPAVSEDGLTLVRP